MSEETSPYLLPRAQDQRLGAEPDQLPPGSTGTSSGTELSRDGNLHGSGMSHATTASPNHPPGHLGGWATPWSAEEMLDGQHQRVDIPGHTRTGYKGLLQKRLEEDLC